MRRNDRIKNLIRKPIENGILKILILYTTASLFLRLRL
jgi:hypothetical protein